MNTNKSTIQNTEQNLCHISCRRDNIFDSLVDENRKMSEQIINVRNELQQLQKENAALRRVKDNITLLNDATQRLRNAWLSIEPLGEKRTDIKPTSDIGEVVGIFTTILSELSANK